MVLLSLTGLIAGLLTACLVYPVGRLSIIHTRMAWYLLGAPFGAAVAVSLASCRVFRGLQGFWKAILLLALSIAAYFLSYWVAALAELSIHRQGFVRGQTISSFALFAGGFVGGLLVLGGAFLLAYPRSGFGTGTTTLKVLLASVLCGILGIVGWTLGPYLGIHVWSMMHTLGLTPSTETFQNALHGDISRQYSLFVVWQTCTAFLLGLILQAGAQKQIRLGTD